MTDRGTGASPAQQRLAVQYAVSRMLLEAQDSDDALPRLLLAIGEGMTWRIGASWCMHEEPGLLRCCHFCPSGSRALSSSGD